MSIYWVWSYYGKGGKVTEYLKWLSSDEAKLLASQIEKETGMKYLNTYTTILSFGDYDAEDWWAAPDWASLDKMRGCKALAEWTRKTLGHDRPDKASKVKDDANGQRSQGHRETREVDRTTVGQNYYSLSGTDQTSCGGTPAGDDAQSLGFWCVCASAYPRANS